MRIQSIAQTAGIDASTASERKKRHDLLGLRMLRSNTVPVTLRSNDRLGVVIYSILNTNDSLCEDLRRFYVENGGGNTFADLYAKAVLVIAKALSISAINPWLAPHKLTPLLPRKEFWLRSYRRLIRSPTNCRA